MKGFHMNFQEHFHGQKVGIINEKFKIWHYQGKLLPIQGSTR